MLLPLLLPLLLAGVSLHSTTCLLTEAWVHQVAPTTHRGISTKRISTQLHATEAAMAGNLHGQNACFLPLQQLDSDYYAPRIIQIAGAYPGLKKQEYMAVNTQQAPDQGQWTYDFSDPDGPQMGTVAIEGSATLYSVRDPVVIIAEHTALGVDLPAAIVDPVDLVVVCDRDQRNFAERAFLVLAHDHDDSITIQAFSSKQEMPTEGVSIVGHVQLVQIPWLPAMKPTKTGFLEADEYF